MGLPAGTWDCHAHIIGERASYPLSTQRSYDPPLALLEDYVALLDRVGIARGYLVQPSVYGFDNRCLLDALDRADGRLLGIAVPARVLRRVAVAADTRLSYASAAARAARQRS